MFNKKRDKSRENGDEGDITSEIVHRIEELKKEEEAPENGNDTPRAKSRDQSKNRSQSEADLESLLGNIDDWTQDNPNLANNLANGLGRILMNHTAHINALSKKLKIPTGLEADDVSFYLDNYHEKLEKAHDNKTKELRDSLINENETEKKAKEDRLRIAYFQVKDIILPPEEFAEYDVLKYPSNQLGHANGEFTIKPKFSGDSKGCSIVQFLKSMNTAQKRIRVSKNEFQDYLLRNSTGIAYDYIESMIDGDVSLDELYKSLMKKFDNRTKPNDARKQLLNYKAPPNATLNQIETDLMNLGQRARTIYTKGESRDFSYNYECCQSLLRVLPEAVQPLAMSALHRITRQTGKQPTFNELSAELHQEEDVIDFHLKKRNRYENKNENREDAHQKGKPFENKKSYGQRNWMYQNKGNIRAVQVNSENMNYNPRQSRPTENRYSEKFQGNRKFVQNKQNYGNQNNRRFQPRLTGGNATALGIGGRYKCTLCNSQNHNSSDGCFKIRNDNGKIVWTPPSQAPCEICKKETGKILYHRENLCFNRPRAKELIAQGKFKYPTYEERKQLQEYIKGVNKD